MSYILDFEKNEEYISYDVLINEKLTKSYKK